MKYVIKLIAASLVSVIIMLLLASCGDDEPIEDYERGTILYIAVEGGSIVFSGLGAEGVTPDDGVTYHNGDLKPVWSTLASRLGISLLPADTASADVVIASPDTLLTMCDTLVDLSAHLGDMSDLSDYLDDHPFAHLSAISDPTVGSMYLAPIENGDPYGRVPVMRADWIRTLLDGQGDFTAEQCGTLTSYSYTPYYSACTNVTVPIYNGEEISSVEKRYTASGNIVYTMNLHMDNEPLDGVTAVNMLRDYVDDAYGGFYGNNRSELFLGERAAWDADELVALLRCIYTNAYTLTGDASVSPLFFDGEREEDILAFAGTLFGARGLARDGDRSFVAATGRATSAYSEDVTYDAIAAMYAIVAEGLVTLDANEGAVTYRRVLDGEYSLSDSYSLTLPPIAYWETGRVGGEYLRFTETDRLLGACIAVSSSVTVDRDRLGASLALVDYVYSEEGRALVTYAAPTIDGAVDSLYRARELYGASYLGFDSVTLAYGTLTERARDGVDMLERMSLYGIACGDEVSFTEDPWFSTPFDNMSHRLPDAFDALTDPSVWSECYGRDPLLDVILYGYTDNTISERALRDKLRDELLLDDYTEALGDTHESLLNYYKLYER